jgi:hypothetical protein
MIYFGTLLTCHIPMIYFGTLLTGHIPMIYFGTLLTGHMPMIYFGTLLTGHTADDLLWYAAEQFFSVSFNCSSFVLFDNK